MSRRGFIDGLAGDGGPRHVVLTAPIGAGKSWTLRATRRLLEKRGLRCAFIDLFTAASTPEALTAGIVSSLGDARGRGSAFGAHGDASSVETPSRRLLTLIDRLRAEPPVDVWLVDEVTEIRSLAYFPDLSDVERPFEAMLRATRTIATSSYPGLVRAYLPGLHEIALEPLAAEDLAGSRAAVARDAVAFSGGLAAGAFMLAAEGAADAESLARLLEPGAPLEIACRRHYDVLLMRSRGYAVCKMAAEAVAQRPRARLTDLVPAIGRTPGASRQYLFWLVEVGLIAQTRKRYDFVDPLLGLWARIYLRAEGARDVRTTVAEWVRERAAGAEKSEPASGDGETERPAAEARRRADRFEEIF